MLILYSRGTLQANMPKQYLPLLGQPIALYRYHSGIPHHGIKFK